MCVILGCGKKGEEVVQVAGMEITIDSHWQDATDSHGPQLMQQMPPAFREAGTALKKFWTRGAPLNEPTTVLACLELNLPDGAPSDPKEFVQTMLAYYKQVGTPAAEDTLGGIPVVRAEQAMKRTGPTMQAKVYLFPKGGKMIVWLSAGIAENYDEYSPEIQRMIGSIKFVGEG